MEDIYIRRQTHYKSISTHTNIRRQTHFKSISTYTITLHIRFLQGDSSNTAQPWTCGMTPLPEPILRRVKEDGTRSGQIASLNLDSTKSRLLHLQPFLYIFILPSFFFFPFLLHFLPLPFLSFLPSLFHSFLPSFLLSFLPSFLI